MSDPDQTAPTATAGARSASGLPRVHYRMIRRVLAAFPPLRAEGVVIAAVSGGCDSMALLELLALARRVDSGAARVAVTAAYVDHGQRPVAAREAAIVAAAAARHGIGFVRLQPYEELAAGASEADLRAARYRALEALAERLGADWITTGHHRDDQTETLLLRLLRGGGRLGLAGIPQRRGRILRPLLDMTRAELERFLRARGIGWVEDASNASPRYARNRLRRVVLPVIERELGRGALDHLPELAARMRIEEDYLAAQTRRYAAYVVRDAAGCDALDLVALERVPVALRGRLLRQWFAGLPGGRSLTIAQVAALERLADRRGGSSQIAIAGLTIRREYARLCLAPAALAAPRFAFPVATARPSVLEDPAGRWRVLVDPEPRGAARTARSLYRDECDLALDPDAGALALRPAAAGDRIGRSGHGTSKVHDIMVELRVPSAARPQWPVLVEGQRIVWVPGIAVADDATRIGANSTRVRFGWHRRR